MATFGYSRVSTVKQAAEGESLDVQRRQIEGYALMHGLVLDDGSVVRVVGRSEPLVEIAAENPRQLARLAWHIGNRHTEIEIVGDRLRIRRDSVLEAMLRGLGAKLSFVEAPFEPEAGAYEHGHRHDHHHGPHDHES